MSFVSHLQHKSSKSDDFAKHMVFQGRWFPPPLPPVPETGISRSVEEDT